MRRRRCSILITAACAAFALLASSGTAYADTVFDMTVSAKGETRAVKLDIGGDALVSLNKVSDPGVQVRVTASDIEASVSMRVNAPGENGCSAVDDVTKGTLNRTVTVSDGGWAILYVKVWYTTTTPIGLSWVTVVEPFGPTGLLVAGPGYFGGLPVGVCVA